MLTVTVLFGTVEVLVFAPYYLNNSGGWAYLNGSINVAPLTSDQVLVNCNCLNRAAVDYGLTYNMNSQNGPH